MEEQQSKEWREWTSKHDVIDASDLRGCEDLAHPTWTNRHIHGPFLAKRLDRVYFFEQALWLSHEVKGSLLFCHTVSDHTPIKASCKCKVQRTVGRGPPPFKFSTSFLKDPSFCKELKEAWCKASSAHSGPLEKWKAGMYVITEVAKTRGKTKASSRRAEVTRLEYALKCTREAAKCNPHEPNLLQMLQNLEKAASESECQKAEAACVQTRLYCG